MPSFVYGTGTRCRAITDIVQSVALEQVAISHILNAEGEKIQKAISQPGVQIAQLVAVNESVLGVVDALTRLEQALVAKLTLFEGCLCPTPVVDPCGC